MKGAMDETTTGLPAVVALKEPALCSGDERRPGSVPGHLGEPRAYPPRGVCRGPDRGAGLDLRGQALDLFYVADIAGASSVGSEDGQLTMTIWKPGEGERAAPLG
jgi:hypothetical protein